LHPANPTIIPLATIPVISQPNICFMPILLLYVVLIRAIPAPFVASPSPAALPPRTLLFRLCRQRLSSESCLPGTPARYRFVYGLPSHFLQCDAASAPRS